MIQACKILQEWVFRNLNLPSEVLPFIVKALAREMTLKSKLVGGHRVAVHTWTSVWPSH